MTSLSTKRDNLLKLSVEELIKQARKSPEFDNFNAWIKNPTKEELARFILEAKLV